MNTRILVLGASVLCNCFCSGKAQPSFGDGYLTLNKAVQMPDVKGRIDHMDVNIKDKIVYMAALGNNTLEVIDLQVGKVVHSIKGLDKPQGKSFQNKSVLPENGKDHALLLILSRKSLPLTFCLTENK